MGHIDGTLNGIFFLQFEVSKISCRFKVSLYPFVMKTGLFPVGHPEVFTRERLIPDSPPLPWTRSAQNPYRGLLLLRVLPPSDDSLSIPLLPYRTHDGRLTFPLCAKCAELRQLGPCEHFQDNDRSWVAAYTHQELNRALDLGYHVTDLFEVWICIISAHSRYKFPRSGTMPNGRAMVLKRIHRPSLDSTSICS